MYRQFRFEGDIHASLACVPLVVRRKLDLAGLKISLAGWQALTRAERLSLCHLPVDSAEEVGVYREILESFAGRAGAALVALPDVSLRPWNASAVPQEVRQRALTCGRPLGDAEWSRLDEEARFALAKLAEPKRDPAKFGAALGELFPDSGELFPDSGAPPDARCG